MAQKYRPGLIVLFYCIVLSLCQDSSQELTEREEYIEQFNSIPKLFEYLLDMLEKRPEILENNNISAFMESDEKRDKRETDLHGVDENINEGNDIVDVTERREYGNSIKKVERSKKSLTNENKDDTNKAINKEMNNADVTKNKRCNEFGESYFGSTNIMPIVSPEEVEEMALKVEKEIEDHVKNQRK